MYSINNVLTIQALEIEGMNTEEIKEILYNKWQPKRLESLNV